IWKLAVNRKGRTIRPVPPRSGVRAQRAGAAARGLSNVPERRVLAGLLVDADQTQSDGVQREPDPIANLELVEDVVQVRLDRDLADREALRDLGVVEAEPDQPYDLTLAGGERLGSSFDDLRGHLALQCRRHPDVSLA